MSVALAANAPTTFEIKSANLPLVALLLKSADLARLSTEFAKQFGGVPDFFDHDALVIDLFSLQTVEPGANLDFVALMQMLRQYRLTPLAVRGGDEAQMAQAMAAGLISAPDATLHRGPATPAASEAAPVAQPTVAPPPAAGALVIDKPLRSGQQVYARGRDLVLMAMVNPGAEIMADGHIHVYAPLRGKAIAGARGNTEARIFALNMAPELVSVAGIYRTSEVPFPNAVLGKPAQVRLVIGEDGEKLVIDPLSV
ncbi:MAG: septum site-determining protein MinC [Hydrogenophaga sp.]|jgi:septum site-determining protein MinC|uniref:septum site-determining protein MinC n=1 Tax=Hydrogenophaga sp. TaxID=1904254 RepID=UPI00271F68B0|nr:septum site-determining protein MinC [Hydrogenophaga sp.]MDO9482870.1 septum site-determining protein MinC [Hydrogenophaga sp.]MDO9570921.1 septum site-determining protein MinC [Hydrogenophaga sp.]MDP1895004.1 septum site-determining protein MinC [Hydrogenophaga sp.]MDP2096325.1 septum site-determining protein MinC [Hydrogenophaga sp.]MDP2166205.1 septum site-determining protein MinC [Hydrogenophaga sp.]